MEDIIVVYGFVVVVDIVVVVEVIVLVVVGCVVVFVVIVIVVNNTGLDVVSVCGAFVKRKFVVVEKQDSCELSKLS